ncbi:hypothetical protein TWF506_008802 [Arthrobotrys conoides]|uniref:Uncharacterized protein n=1 Tax=Arthrobotrys conoides TaxID=74498 RepID=A0AAN8NQE8_9PEZI
MASVKNQNTYRASGLRADITLEGFRRVLRSQLTNEEKRSIKVNLPNLAPSPISNGHSWQTAIFSFHPKVPSFLNIKNFNKEGKLHIRDTRNSRIEIDFDFWGLTQLYRPRGEICLDIVAVTGLNGHAFGSWVGATTDWPKPMWLWEFLADEPYLGPRCRVMIYGYNAKTKSTAVHTTDDYVNGFLSELMKARARDSEVTRPLVLLGHCYGGLIISHAFTKSFWNPCFKSIYHSTVGIFFFGVPHKGIYLEDVDKAVRSNLEEYEQGIRLLKSIDYEAAVTPNTDFFRHLVEKSKLRLTQFYETLKTPMVQQLQGSKDYGRIGDGVIVVSRDSAVVGVRAGFEEAHDSDGNHSSLVKITKREDRTYTTIRDILLEIIRSGGNEVQKRIKNQNAEEKQHRDSVKSNSHPESTTDKARYIYIHSQLLRIAAHANKNSLAEWLLQNGADPNLPIDAQNKKYSGMQWRFDLGYIPNSQEELSENITNQKIVGQILQSSETALALAIKRRNPETVELLLRYHANPNSKCSADENSKTPLHEACLLGDASIVQHILSKNADTNATTKYGSRSPLHEVAEAGWPLESLLLDHGARIDARTRNGDTALHIAAGKGHIGLVQRLHEKGADVAALNNDKATSLHEAAKFGHVLVASVLLKRDKDRVIMDFQDVDGHTALHNAAYGGHVEMVKFLLEKGANRMLKTCVHETAFELAIRNGHRNLGRLFET